MTNYRHLWIILRSDFIEENLKKKITYNPKTIEMSSYFSQVFSSLGIICDYAKRSKNAI